jgi:PhoH-like ATPase
VVVRVLRVRSGTVDGRGKERTMRDVTDENKSKSLPSRPAHHRLDVGSGTPLVVLDTCVLLADPDALYAFPGTDLVIPLTVIEELDAQKNRLDDIGRAARITVRNLEQLRLSAGGDLRSPASLPHSGTVRITINGLRQDLLRAHGLSVEKSDNRILGVALGLQEEDQAVKLVSLDVNMRIKAASLGLVAEDWARNRAHEQRRAGWRELPVSGELLDRFHAERGVDILDAGFTEDELLHNEFAVLRSGKQSGLARRRGNRLEPLSRMQPWGLAPRSKEQAFALDLLLDTEVPLVALSGSAGTGKTITALAAALAQVFEPSTAHYDRLTIIRPLYSVGRQDIGFLPGDVDEKIGPWFESITDTMVALGDRVTHNQAARSLDAWIAQGRLAFQPVTYLRGRSLQKTLVIVDESQNLEAPLTLKTILTRIGEGSKIVMLGDTSQIDNVYAGPDTNALAMLVDRFAGQELFGQVVLTRGERSPLANLAAELL